MVKRHVLGTMSHVEGLLTDSCPSRRYQEPPGEHKMTPGATCALCWVHTGRSFTILSKQRMGRLMRANEGSEISGEALGTQQEWERETGA